MTKCCPDYFAHARELQSGNKTTLEPGVQHMVGTLITNKFDRNKFQVVNHVYSAQTHTGTLVSFSTKFVTVHVAERV